MLFIQFSNKIEFSNYYTILVYVYEFTHYMSNGGAGELPKFLPTAADYKKLINKQINRIDKQYDYSLIKPSPVPHWIFNPQARLMPIFITQPDYTLGFKQVLSGDFSEQITIHIDSSLIGDDTLKPLFDKLPTDDLPQPKQNIKRSSNSLVIYYNHSEKKYKVK